MNRFKNILAIYDQLPGDDSTLKRATSLARRNGARLTVAEVARYRGRLNARIALQREWSAERVVAERSALLERLIVSIRHEGVEVSATILSGTPVLAIIEAVHREEYDLVILTAEAHGAGKRVLFGSISTQLMRKCPCPVWVTDPDQRSDSYSRILAAVDTTSSDEINAALNTLIMELSTSLARIDQSELHVVHAWEMNRRNDETCRSETTEENRHRLLRRNLEQRRRGVDALLARYELQDLDYRVHMVRDEARSGIPQIAAKLRADLLVMGTVSRAGIPGFFLGNTAEATLRQVECSVLTLKPPGFESPVGLLPLRMADGGLARSSRTTPREKAAVHELEP